MTHAPETGAIYRLQLSGVCIFVVTNSFITYYFILLLSVMHDVLFDFVVKQPLINITFYRLYEFLYCIVL